MRRFRSASPAAAASSRRWLSVSSAAMARRSPLVAAEELGQCRRDAELHRIAVRPALPVVHHRHDGRLAHRRELRAAPRAGPRRTRIRGRREARRYCRPAPSPHRPGRARRSRRILTVEARAALDRRAIDAGEHLAAGVEAPLQRLAAADIAGDRRARDAVEGDLARAAPSAPLHLGGRQGDDQAQPVLGDLAPDDEELEAPAAMVGAGIGGICRTARAARP